MEGDEAFFFKMETGSLFILHGWNNERIVYCLVIKMTIDTLVMQYCFGVFLIARCPVHVVGNQVVEIGPGKAARHKQEQQQEGDTFFYDGVSLQNKIPVR